MWLVLLFVIIIGLCIGSFLNVVILRALSNESIVFPASKCPKCQHTLKWWHNIPVLSYILLRGKCGFCKEKISIQYPIIEILTSIVFAITFLKFGISLDLLFAWIFGSLFIVLAGTDWKKQVVYDKHTYALIGMGLLYAIITAIAGIIYSYNLFGKYDFTPEALVINPITISLLGIIGGFVIMEIISRIGYLIAGDRAFGEGDSFILAGLGAVFGWQMILPILIFSVVVQVIITLPVYIKKEFDNKKWMTLISIGIFSVYAIFFAMAYKFGWLSNDIAYIFSAVILAILGILACREILRGIRQPENRTYLPFGPALLFTGMLLLLIF